MLRFFLLEFLKLCEFRSMYRISIYCSKQIILIFYSMEGISVTQWKLLVGVQAKLADSFIAPGDSSVALHGIGMLLNEVRICYSALIV